MNRSVNDLKCDSLDDVMEAIYAQSRDFDVAHLVDQTSPLPSIFLDCFKKSKQGNLRILAEMRVYLGDKVDASQDEEFTVTEVVRLKVKGYPNQQRLRIKVKEDKCLKFFWNKVDEVMISRVTLKDLKITLFDKTPPIVNIPMTYVYELKKIL